MIIKKNILLKIMIKKNINKYIDNLFILIKYAQNEFKITIDNEKINKDDRYLNGIVRYIDNSGYYNRQNIQNTIKNTYYIIANVIQIPLIDKNKDLYHNKLLLYILYLDSLPGLRLICNKYNIQCEYILLCEKVIPILNKYMGVLEKEYIN